MSKRDAARFLVSRAATTGLYVLAIVGITGWNRESDSWIATGFNLLTAVTFLWWSIARTIDHHHEDHGGNK